MAGSASTPASAAAQSDAATSTTASALDSGSTNTTPTTPSVIDISDDALVRIGNAKDPVKWGEYYRGQQSQFTRASQRAAALERQHAEAQAALKEREDRLARLEAALNDTRKPKRDPLGETLSSLKSRPYLTGEEAAQALQLFAERADGFQAPLAQRDQAILLLGQHLARLNKDLSSVQAERQQVAFDRKIDGWMKELSVPDEARDLMVETYLAYEGDDLDSEFPSMFAKKWDAIQKIVRTQDAARRAAKRTLPFVPGKGGTGSAAKPLNTGNMSPAEIADHLWAGMDSSDNT